MIEPSCKMLLCLLVWPGRKVGNLLLQQAGSHLLILTVFFRKSRIDQKKTTLLKGVACRSTCAYFCMTLSRGKSTCSKFLLFTVSLVPVDQAERSDL